MLLSFLFRRQRHLPLSLPNAFSTTTRALQTLLLYSSCQGMLWGASSATDRQSPLEYNDPHLPRQCSQNSSVMHTPRHSCTHAPKQSFSIDNTLKDDGMPAFSIEVVNMALLWGYNGYVWPINGTNTLRKAPLLLNVGCHFFEFLLVRKNISFLEPTILQCWNARQTVVLLTQQIERDAVIKWGPFRIISQCCTDTHSVFNKKKNYGKQNCWKCFIIHKLISILWMFYDFLKLFCLCVCFYSCIAIVIM